VVVPKEAPPEYEFLADPPSISAFDLGKTVRKGNTVPYFHIMVKQLERVIWTIFHIMVRQLERVIRYFPHYGKTVGKGNTVFSTLW